MSHPRHQLDDVIHSPVRLSIMAILAAAGETDNRFLKNAVEVSDSLLSKHIGTLESAGYVKIIKGYTGKRPCTWYSLTDLGRDRFDEYRAALASVLDGNVA